MAAVDAELRLKRGVREVGGEDTKRSPDLLVALTDCLVDKAGGAWEPVEANLSLREDDHWTS